MKLTVLGMNGPFPAALGATSGYLLESGSTRVALDLGSGTLGRLTALGAPEDLDALVLTHWHFDHCSDLLPLIFRLEAAGAALDVYAPADESSAVRKIAEQAACLRLHTVQPGDQAEIGGLRLRFFAARHPVPAIMVRAEAEGKAFCYTGDTNTVDGLAAFADRADLLLADGLFPTALWAEGKPHLSAALAAKLAADADVRALVLTHLNPNIDPGILLEEARPVYPAVRLAKPGAVYTV